MKAIFNGEIIAESNDTIIIEGNHYFPPSSLKKEFFKESTTHSTCPWKGYASYFTVEPSDRAKEIKGYVAFWNGVKVTA